MLHPSLLTFGDLSTDSLNPHCEKYVDATMNVGKFWNSSMMVKSFEHHVLSELGITIIQNSKWIWALVEVISI